MSDATQPDPIPGDGDPVATGAKGSGEWPPKDTPPTEPAPGIDPDRAAEIKAKREANVTLRSELDEPEPDSD